MNVFYWKSKPNFGDLLTSLLLKRFANLDSQWTNPENADLVMIGSILHLLPEHYSGVIAGCGQMHEFRPVMLRKANVLSVRGPLTARNFRGSFGIGDPGLLADELVGYRDKEYNLGIVPHWTDKELEKRPEFLKYNPLIIRPSDDPLKVIEQIAKCKKIVSSSLHGIILADAYGIPRRIEIAPRMLSHPEQEGKDFKFRDYAASLNMPLEFGITAEPNAHRVTELQHEIFDVLEELRSIFKNA